MILNSSVTDKSGQYYAVGWWHTDNTNGSNRLLAYFDLPDGVMLSDYDVTINTLSSISHATLDVSKFTINEGLSYGLAVSSTDATYMTNYVDTGAVISYTLTKL